MFNILFNSLINFTINYRSLLDIALLDKLFNFYILSLNNQANPSAIILSVVTTKYIIFNNPSHTTKITFFSATYVYFVIKSTVMSTVSLASHLPLVFLPESLYSFSSFGISHMHLHICIFLCFLLLLVTKSFLLLC